MADKSSVRPSPEILHGHDFFEITYISRGKGSHIVDGREYRFRGSCFCFTPQGRTHSFFFPQNEKHSRFSLAVYPDWINSHITGFDINSIINTISGKNIYVLEIPQHFLASINPLYESILQESIFNFKHAERILCGEIVKLFIIIHRIMDGSAPPELNQNILHPAVLHAVKIIQTQYTKKLQIQDLIRGQEIDSRYFSTLFKKQTGLPPFVYLNKVRIDRTIALLETGSMTVIQAAFQAGYNDLKHFYAQFRKFKGSLPKQYLKMLKR